MNTNTMLREGQGGPALYVLLVGESHEIEMLRFRLTEDPIIRQVGQVTHMHHAWGEIRAGKFNTVVVDMPYGLEDMNSIVLSIFRVREEYPEIVFGLLAEEKELLANASRLEPEARMRLGHYYRIPRSLDPEQIGRFIERCRRWHGELLAKRPHTARYKYDVALSFAGEQRKHAQELATILQAHSVRVFYDDFEQAELWGKNLFEHLFKVYAEESRYCIVFISADYATKMWTVHERRAAQERVLKERELEYLLPIRIDDTRLPGLPDTVAYLDIKQSVPKIAELFIRKLGGTIGRLS